MDISNADKELLSGLLSNFEISLPSFDCLEEDQVFTKVNKLFFFDVIERLMATRGNVSTLASVFEFVTFLFKHVVDWNLHFNCVKVMLPMFYETRQEKADFKDLSPPVEVVEALLEQDSSFVFLQDLLRLASEHKMRFGSDMLKLELTIQNLDPSN
ncbi:hypothetical protein AVEN_82489-1 [Araneus ventricosus]|uniref:Uncharacterized protein n=1 Tax=Araneus ventricosus TaxID=182803 RepID=A0A4Y2RPV7_ARAVE|nr:hypothetical protein AVEN_82489-1 [Araneus ventricosus]